MKKMQVSLMLLVASASTVFAYYGHNVPKPKSPTMGCLKMFGISQLPLTEQNVCDKRDACDIISPGGKCVSTFLDQGGKFLADFSVDSYPIMTCSSANCSASSPPKGFQKDSIQCVKTPRELRKACGCPGKTTEIYSCGVCFSPKTSTCFCCTG